MKNIRPCIILFLLLTLLTGVLYPFTITALAQLIFPAQANGSLIRVNNEIRGSLLIGQEFTSPAYFLTRPSASDYSAVPSAGSNQGPTSAALKSAIGERKKELAPLIPGVIPADLLMASGSGLDPHISPEAALAQIGHVAEARHLTAAQKSRLVEIVRRRIESPQMEIFGAPRVNVLMLNIETDRVFGVPKT